MNSAQNGRTDAEKENNKMPESGIYFKNIPN